MLKKVRDFVSQNPGVKARAIATQLGFERSSVNALLHTHKDIFHQDEFSCWSLLAPAELHVEFGGKTWLTAKDVEKLLSKAGSPLDSPCQQVVFSLKEGSRMMLDALARLLALSNQLAHAGKAVVLDFTESRGTATYLDRLPVSIRSRCSCPSCEMCPPMTRSGRTSWRAASDKTPR